MAESGFKAADTLPALAESVIAAFFSHNERPLLDLITDDCLIISSTGVVLEGLEGLATAIKDHRKIPSMMVRETDFRLVSSPENRKSGVNAVIAGTYKLYSSPREQMLFSSTEHVTVCFTLTEEGWRICHMHTSTKPSETVTTDIFPIATSRETYDYVREILRTGARAGILPSRVMLENPDSSHYINPDSILYVEAEGKRSIIHCTNTEFPVASLISEVIPQLPGTFFRVHRSYLVNTAHIVGIRKYMLELSDGTEIPIPERRYTEVRREITLRAAGGHR